MRRDYPPGRGPVRGVVVAVALSIPVWVLIGAIVFLAVT